MPPRLEAQINPKRVKLLTKAVLGGAPTGSKSAAAPDASAARKPTVVYWMARDQRVQQNWALIKAKELASIHQATCVVVFNLVPSFLGAPLRHYHFMIEGLREVEQQLRELRIPFYLLQGQPKESVSHFASANNAIAVVTDMSPLRVSRKWQTEVAEVLDGLPAPIPMMQVDAHNIVPVWVASDKQETAARTIRPKIEAAMGEYLTRFPEVEANESDVELPTPVDWDNAYESIKVDASVGKVEAIKPGRAAGQKVLDEFCERRLAAFGTARNDPNSNSLSGLSPYFHFGQIGPQHAILTVKAAASKNGSLSASCATFVEEAVVRRELSDNFCYYNPNYDSLKGAANWARETLEAHKGDRREWVYSQEQLEKSQTHDALWNAAQRQMVNEGKMFGYLRMYWAKKLLEWTESPEEALRIGIYLNDRFSLDGRDPNGYVGVMWSIAGVHDIGFAERAIFGKIRFMNYDGCKRKFKVDVFEKKYRGAYAGIFSAKSSKSAGPILLKKAQGGANEEEKESGKKRSGAAASSASKSRKTD